MKKLTIATAAAIAAMAAPAASEGLYAGAGYTHYDNDAVELGAVTGRLGYEVTPNLAVEGEIGTGVSDDNGAELDTAWGVYGVGKVDVTSNIDVFGRVGYQGVEIEGGGPPIDSDGVGYGVGAQLNVTPQFGVRAEYTKLDGDLESDSIGVSGVMRF
jgi:hypothetical protein